MAQNHRTSEELFKLFDELGLTYNTVEHPEVFTVEEMMPHVQHLPGVQCKNLLLRDKKKRNLWLLSTRHNAKVSLNDLAKLLSAAGAVRMADESVLEEKLGVKQGCVTAFALVNDKNHEVKFVIDQKLLDDDIPFIYFHPLRNNATTGMSPADIKKFLSYTGHEPVTLAFEDLP